MKTNPNLFSISPLLLGWWSSHITHSHFSLFIHLQGQNRRPIQKLDKNRNPPAMSRHLPLFYSSFLVMWWHYGGLDKLFAIRHCPSIYSTIAYYANNDGFVQRTSLSLLGIFFWVGYEHNMGNWWDWWWQSGVGYADAEMESCGLKNCSICIETWNSHMNKWNFCIRVMTL